jgi:hypothetical protein
VTSAAAIAVDVFSFWLNVAELVITGCSLTLITVTDTVSTSVNEPPSVAVIWTS